MLYATLHTLQMSDKEKNNLKNDDAKTPSVATVQKARVFPAHIFVVVVVAAQNGQAVNFKTEIYMYLSVPELRR